MKVHPRSVIKHYIVNMLKAEVDVNDRVYPCRPTSPLFLNELPALCVYFGEETTETISGDEYFVKEYKRTLPVIITIAVEDIVNPDDLINESQKGEDYLDYLGVLTENALFYDNRLARRLSDFDPNTNYLGLTHGSRLNGVVPYDVKTESERRIIAQDIIMEYPYQYPGYKDLRLYSFTEYYNAIIRINSNESTVDRELIEMQGELHGA